MAKQLTRRGVLAAAGLGGAALAGTGLVAIAVQEYRRGLLSAEELRRLPRVPESIRPTDRAALGRESIQKIAAEPALASRLVEYRLTPGAGLEGLGVDVHQFAAEFVCDPRRPNLLIDGVERLSYEIVEVAWQPGEGWPIYRQRAPHAEPAFGTRYAGVPRHQIVLIDDRGAYVGNLGTSGVLDGIRGPVRIDVNGDDHGQHRGFYKIAITGVA